MQEIHLAGHSRVQINGSSVLIDTHAGPVSDSVWALYAAAVTRFGSIPVLIEWDADLPSFDVLQAEADKADALRRNGNAIAA